MPRGVVKELGLDFQIKGPLSKDELRKILINIAQEFLAMVNADEDVKSYLEISPFEIKRVDITHFIMGSDRRRLDDPYIGIVGIKNGRLDYWILETTDVPKIKTTEKETYEEALQILDNP